MKLKKKKKKNQPHAQNKAEKSKKPSTTLLGGKNHMLSCNARGWKSSD